MVATEDEENPVVVEGLAALITDVEVLKNVLAWENAKYETDYGFEMLDPKDNSCFRVTPSWAFAIKQGDFTGSPTRWQF